MILITLIQSKSVSMITLPDKKEGYYNIDYFNQNGEKGSSQTFDNIPKENVNDFNIVEPKEDLTASKNIITDIDNRVAEQKELEKHGKQDLLHHL